MLVVGDAIIDQYLYGLVDRMSPEDSTVPVLDIYEEEYRLGGCLNVAANLRSLSRGQIYVSSIISDRCAKLLSAREIHHGYSYHLTNLDGIKKTRVFDQNSNKQLVRLDNIKRFSDDMIEEFNLLLKCIDFDEFDCIVVSDYQKGVVSDYLVRKLKNYKRSVFVDTKYPDL